MIAFSAIDNNILAQTLIGLSTFGFVIVLGLVTVLPVLYESVVKMSDLVSFPYKFMSKFSESKNVSFLLAISMCFVLVGILGLAYALTFKDFFLCMALCLASESMVVLLLLLIVMINSTSTIEKEALEAVLEYIPDDDANDLLIEELKKKYDANDLLIEELKKNYDAKDLLIEELNKNYDASLKYIPKDN